MTISRDFICAFSRSAILLLVIGVYTLSVKANPQSDLWEKPRLIVLADMGNEPDEEQQIVHLLACVNELDVEGLIAVTGKYLRTDPRPDLFHRLIDGYARVVDNLRKHAEGWPDPDHLRSVTAAGQQRYGMADVGEGKSTQGSQLIIDVVTRPDPRPVYVVVNAGSNTLAQALLDYRSTHSPEEVEAFVSKLRVFENGSQDNAGAWIVSNFPGIHWVRSNYQTYAYGGPGRDGKPDAKTLGPYVWKPYEYTTVGQHQWALDNIIANHGHLGRLFPLRLFPHGMLMFLEGGGTAPWLGLVEKGLYDPDYPHWGGWSGRFTAERVENVWSRHDDIRPDEEEHAPFYMFADAVDAWTDPESGESYENDYAPIWRWRRAAFNDFEARMDWSVRPFDEANHHPQAVFNGDEARSIVRLRARPGQVVTLDATGSTDPDGDDLVYRWWTYPEAGTYDASVAIDAAESMVASVTIPTDAAGKQIHVIQEVRDDGTAPVLYDYRRIVIDVAK